MAIVDESFLARHNEETVMEMTGGGKLKKAVAWTALAALAIGIIIRLFLSAE